ncbi:hypothetical protein R5W23_005110 [Gemmata sp. JC673]|uniref:DUF1570 domain-containing protein n=1 Tax=Gemmata algarum TaxID=2975278 RepID=A0ABU5F8Q3_9BACT|nr:hypothetical protein [Gemmata algarum]MDY3563498.1 hypothetical protein [Gemmata algarum]
MLRCVLVTALAGVLVLAPCAPAADLPPHPTEKQLAVQAAMVSAREHLGAHRPTEAVAELEKEISNADGNTVFLSLLREAYQAELAQSEKAPVPDQKRTEQIQRRLAILNGKLRPAPAPVGTPRVAAEPAPNLGPSLVPPTVTEEPAPPVPPAGSPPAPTAGAGAAAADAVAAFKSRNYADADRLFAALGAARLSAEQKAAWAYCRVKLAADRVNAPDCPPGTAAAAVQEVSEAIQLIPPSADLYKVAQQVLKAAQAKAGAAAAVVPVAASADVLETASFRVHHGGDRALGEAVAKAAEANRKATFERWSGPPGGAWNPKCDVVIHATADAYAAATGKPAALTGHASVSLTNGRPTARRIDLRADDPALATNALPRELTHVVLADLFADRPPPKWALEGMAVLAGAPTEVERYTRTLARCARDGELRALAALFELKDFPADNITGFYCQSVSVTDYLIKLKGERHFKIFLNDAQRYGTPQALRRQYNIDGPQALEVAWKLASLTP